VFADTQQPSSRQLRLRLEPRRRGRRRRGRGRRDDDDVDAVSGRVVFDGGDALQETVRMEPGVLSTRLLARVLVQRCSQALSQRHRDRLRDGVRRADDDVTA